MIVSLVKNLTKRLCIRDAITEINLGKCEREHRL